MCHYFFHSVVCMCVCVAPEMLYSNHNNKRKWTINDDGLIKKETTQCKGQPPTGAVILYGGLPTEIFQFFSDISSSCCAASRYKPSQDTQRSTQK